MDNTAQTYTQLLTEIEALCQRLDALTKAEETAHTAIAEQQCTLEELQVAEEELRQQNDELLAARQAVEAEHVRYQTLFDLAPDGYLVTDANGIIQEANRAAVALLAVSQEELIRKPCILFVAEEDRSAFHMQLLRLRQVQRVQDWELRLSPRAARPALPALQSLSGSIPRSSRLRYTGSFVT
jgi:PAS domain-containing protein